MKVIVAGSRHITDQALVDNILAFSSPFEITEVVCGGAPGVDSAGAAWAHCQDIAINYFSANWNLHGKAAGPIRNGEMAAYADAAIVIWDGTSRGSKNMIKHMTLLGKPVYSVLVSAPVSAPVVNG